MKHTFKRVLCMLCALVMLLGCFAWSALATEATVDEGDAPSGTMLIGGAQKNKWTIIGTDTTVSVAAAATMGITKSSLGIDLPDSMSLEGLALYMHVTHTADSAALMNKGSGQIELAKDTCDHYEICVSDNQSWVKGENKILIPIGRKGSFTDGSTAPMGRFDLHETINHFRFYSLNAAVATSMVIHEISIVDITGVDTRTPGSLFGDGDTYLQMESALTTPPSSFEASIKMDADIVAYDGMWEIGLPANGRYSSMTTTTGTVGESEAVDGLAADTAYKSYTIPSGNYFGLSDYKFTAIKIPSKYTKDDLALTFWVYWKPSVSGTPFNLYSYIELTSSGKCDVNELCWVTSRAEFKNMKEGWNYIVLPFSEASVSGGEIDVSNINFTRIHGSTNAQYLATCDYELAFTSFKVIALEKQAPEQDENVETETSWSLGLPGAMRVDLQRSGANATPTATNDAYLYESKDPTTGEVTAEDVATYGMPAGLKYVGGTVKGGYEYTYETGETDDEGNPITATALGGGNFGLSGKKITAVSVPDQYTKNDLALVFWLYTSTGSLGVDNGFFQLELTSAGVSDNEEIMFSNTHAGFKNVKAGWNLIVLPLSSPSATTGTLNLKNINYTRLHGDGKMAEDVTIYVSEMSIVAYPQLSDLMEMEYWRLGAAGTARTDTSIYKMTAKSGKTTAQEAITYNMPYNMSWTGGTVPVGGNFGLNQCWSTLNFPKADEYAVNDLALVFWLYTSTGKLADSKFYFELSNSGKDNRELYWTQSHAAFQDLQVGWNRIILPFRTASTEGADPFTLDLPIKYTRIHGSGSATVETDIYVSDLYIMAYDTPQYTIADGHETWRLVNFGKKPNSRGNGSFSVGNVWTNDGTDALQPVDGTVYMKITPTKYETLTGNYNGMTYWNAGFDCNTTNNFILPNLEENHNVNNLVFSFWMYVPNAAMVPTDISTSPNFEFTSDGNNDGPQLEQGRLWQNATVGMPLQNGWNYVELPLSKMTASGGFDLYAMNYLRWSYMCLLANNSSADDYVYFADFRLTSTVKIHEMVDASTIDTTEIYTILSTNDSTDANPIALFVNYDGNPGFFWGDKAFVATDYCAITGDWEDLALTFDEAEKEFTMYANGDVIAVVNAGDATAILPTVGFAIGADVDGSNLLTGYIADVRIWSDVRTQQEIIDNRVEDKEAFGAVENGLTAQTEGLIGAWTLVGGIDYVLETKPDISASGIDLIYHGSRVDQWELDYEIPTDVIGEDYYSIVFIGDTQNLIGSKNGEWQAVGQWIADNIETENIVHVIGAGDTTWNDTVGEYERARKVWDMFTDKVSWSNIIGNHDYPWKNNTQTIRDTTNYATYYGEEYIHSTMGGQYYVGSFNDPYGLSTTENSYYRFTVNGVQWMILQLEYHPRVHVINWANEIARMYPDDNIILTTHGYIGGDSAAYSTHWMTYTKEDVNKGGYIGSLLDPPQEWHYSGIDGMSDKSSEEPIWTHLIYNNTNIKMLLCGHSNTTDGHILTRRDENAAGEIVPQLMINAQDVDTDYFDDYMMGMIGILRFSADGSKCEIQYYSPYHEASFHPSNQEMRSIELALNEKAEVAGTDGLVYEANGNGGYTVVGYEGDSVDVVIPETYNGLPVNAFAPAEDVIYDDDGAIMLPEDKIEEDDTLTIYSVDSITFLSKTISIAEDSISKTTAIHGYVGSTAESYATAGGNDFVVLAKIVSADVELGSDITVNYYAYLDEAQAANAEMTFLLAGKKTTVAAVATDSPNKYVFKLTNTAPQLMGDTITATLSCDGEVLDVVDNYSIRQYCLNMLKYADAISATAQAKSDALKQLVADLLNYGAKAQLYQDYKQLTLANRDLTVSASDNVELTEADQKKIIGTISDGSAFSSATFSLANVATEYVEFVAWADAVNAGQVSVTVDGEPVSFVATDDTPPKAEQEGMTVYQIEVGAIYACDFECSTVIVLNVNGETQTLKYSFVNYLYGMQSHENTELVDLAHSIRNYGLSAIAYRDAQ